MRQMVKCPRHGGPNPILAVAVYDDGESGLMAQFERARHVVDDATHLPSRGPG